MSKETQMRKSSLILGAALAAVLVTASGCDPYQSANTSQPIVIGAAAVDLFFNEVVPYPGPVDTIPFPYPEPDPTWANTNFPGLCNPANASVGITTICPVSPFPPRTGPAYAPFYLGTNTGSYTCANSAATDVTPANNTCVNGTYTYSLPSDGIFRVPFVPYDVVTLQGTDFDFIQLRVLFNKLMNGKTIEPVPGIGVAKVDDGDGTFVRVTKQAVAIGSPVIDVTCTPTNVTADGCPAGTFTVTYVPNSAVSYFGGTLSVEPVDAVLEAATNYRVDAVVADQQGNKVTVDARFTTTATLPAPTAPRR
jgi:hypothetical protein